MISLIPALLEKSLVLNFEEIVFQAELKSSVIVLENHLLRS